MNNLSQSLVCEHSFPAMGGHFYLKCFPQNFTSRSKVQELFRKAEKEVKRIEEKFTEFNDSPFNRINDFAGIRPVKVDDEIYALIDKSLDLSRKSNGIFDITTSSFLRPWRKAQKQNKILSERENLYFKGLIDFNQVHLNPKEKSIFLPHRDLRIGLGGIGKGYAVDKAFEQLEKEGLYNFYINGSGDIRVHSHHKAPRKWRIAIRNPLSKDPSKSIGLIQVSNHAVATSGGYIQFNKVTNNKSDHHIISKIDNKDRIISATVVAKTSIEADTQATILMNLNLKNGLDYSKQNKVSSILISSDGKVRVSESASKLLSM